MCSGCSGLLLLPQQLIFTFDIIYGPGFGSTLAEICPGYLPHHLTGPRTYLCVFGSAMAVMDVGTRHVCATIGSTPKCWGEHFPPAQIEKKTPSQERLSPKNLTKKINALPSRVWYFSVDPLASREPFEESPRVSVYFAAPTISLPRRASPSAPSARSLLGCVLG